MMNVQRQIFGVGRDSVVGRRGMRWSGRWWRRWFVFALVYGGSVCGGGAAAFAQAPSAGGPGLGIFANVGIQNVQYPSYADNAAGGNAGVFVQPHMLIGAEVRGGLFPVYSKYKQMQMTAGWRVGLKPEFHTWMPYVYGGGGVSWAQDVDATGHTVSGFDPCWQTSVGLDRAKGNWSVRLFEVSYRKTYTPLRTLRSAEATMGLVRRF